MDRRFEIILHGATGFTGKLVAEYLAEHHPDLEWAIAGRSQSKLDAVRKQLKKVELPALVADSNDATSLRAMARQAKVIISTVGPYALHGSALLETCAREGTHYCDLTGEAQWMAEVYDQIDPIARNSGARLVHCCGFDSIPSDLSVYLLQKTFHQRYGHYARDISGRMGRYSGGVSGGTIASLMLVGEQISRDPRIRSLLSNPYALYPSGIEPGTDQTEKFGIHWDESFESWTGPFVMAAINTKVVRRSNALQGFPYGADFQYDESQLCKNRTSAILTTALVGAAMGGTLFSASRALLKRFLPKPGEGPDFDTRASGFFEFWAHGISPETKKSMRVKVTGQRDPGYGATSRMLAQAGLSLARDEPVVDGGIWTPASAMGDALLHRLPTVDISFEVIEPAT